MIDGYHWKLKFYRKDELIDEIEGWPNEDIYPKILDPVR